MLDRPYPAGPLAPLDDLQRSSRLGILGLALAAGFFAYVLTFAQVGFALLDAVEYAFLSVASACIPGVAAWVISRRIQRAAPTLQAALHLPLSLAYSWAWYVVGRIMGAALGVARGDGWAIGWLPDNALAWQLAQGLSVYAAIAAAAYAARPAASAALALEPATDPEPVATRFLARAGEGFAPLNIADIVLVEGADDYSEVTTVAGERRLVRLSLKAFETQLGPDKFVRIHRSLLVALDHLVSVEPAGAGRMLVHVTTGRTVQTSRDGARKLRARMI